MSPKYQCPICGQSTLEEDPLQKYSTYEICTNCNYQSGFDDGGGTLEQRAARFASLKDKLKQKGKL